MIPITVDMSDVAREMQLYASQTADLTSFVVKELTAVIARNWGQMAKKNLAGTRAEYLRSIIVVDKGRFEGAVMLVGTLPNMIESGASPFDMKEGFSKSDKRIHKDDGGWYLTIPFRYATPGSVGESSIFSGVLPKPILESVKKAPGGILTQSLIPRPFNQPTVRQEILKSQAFKEYTAQTSIYAGLTKVTKEYQNASQSQYVTFRRVSDISDPDMFIHKGLDARNLAEKAIEFTNIPSEINRLLQVWESKNL